MRALPVYWRPPMNDDHSDENKLSAAKSRPDKPADKLLYALKFGLSRKKAREWAGLSKERVRGMRDDLEYASKMQAAMVEGDLFLLEKCFSDSHWQAWRLILEYRAGLGKQRLVSKESEPDDNQRGPADDPMAMSLAAQLAQIPPGKEHLMRIVIDDPANAGRPATDVTHAQHPQDLKA
jgi:hypothetical protein